MSTMKVLEIYFLYHFAQSLIYVQIFQYGVNHIQNKCFNLAMQTLWKKSVLQVFMEYKLPQEVLRKHKIKMRFYC